MPPPEVETFHVDQGHPIHIHGFESMDRWMAVDHMERTDLISPTSEDILGFVVWRCVMACEGIASPFRRLRHGPWRGSY
jgi:hypothetical protein